MSSQFTTFDSISYLMQRIHSLEAHHEYPVMILCSEDKHEEISLLKHPIIKVVFADNVDDEKDKEVRLSLEGIPINKSELPENLEGRKDDFFIVCCPPRTLNNVNIDIRPTI